MLSSESMKLRFTEGTCPTTFASPHVANASIDSDRILRTPTPARSPFPLSPPPPGERHINFFCVLMPTPCMIT